MAKSIIFRCTQSGIGTCTGRGWHIQTYHAPTGLRWAEELCPSYKTRAEAEAGNLGERAYEEFWRHIAGGLTGRDALRAAKREL